MKILKLIALLLCMSNLSSGQTPNDDLIKASSAGDLSTVTKLTEGGANVNYKNAGGATPISSAYLWPEVTEYLLAKGADANGGDYPALIQAAYFYSVDVMKLLLKAGANPNKVAEVKVDLAAGVRKALEEEKAKGKKANKYLVKAYEDQLKAMPAGNTMTFTALGQAIAYTNCEECIELLLNAGAKTDFKSPITGGNAVHEVAFNWVSAEAYIGRHKGIVDYYDKASLPVPDWYRNLDVPNMGSAVGILKLLKAKGADFEYLDNNKKTPLSWAVSQPTPNEEMIMALLDNGANLKATGRTNDITEFQNDTDNLEKIKVKYDFPGEGRNSNNGGGYSANIDLVNPKPKRVALISYYLYDPGMGKAKLNTAVWVTDTNEGQAQVNGFYAKSIQPLKDAFKENGMELLTPDEFLDTQEKAELYYGFVPETAKKEHTTIARSKTRSRTNDIGGGWTQTTYTTTSASEGLLKVCPSGKGYRAFFVVNEAENESTISNFQGGVFTANRKLTSSLGYELCQGLGVDAVLVVYIATRQLKQLKSDYGVNAVVTMMLGPNPSRSEGSDPEAKNLGQFYCGTRTFYSSPKIFKENKGIMGQYDGMANILKAHSNKMSKYIYGKEKDEE